MLPVPSELAHLDEGFKQEVHQQLDLIYKGKVKNGLLVKRLLLNTDQAGYVKAVSFLADMWRNKSALAHKSFEIEGQMILELTKIILTHNFIERGLDRSIEATLYVDGVAAAFSDNPRVMRLVEKAHGSIERAQDEAIARVLRLMGEA